MSEEKRNLPAIQDLYDEVAIREKDNAFNLLMNQPPKPDWVKIHPMTNTSYLPIERVEYLLTRIFINWRVEIKTTQLIGNSVAVTVRLHYKSVTTGEWEWQDGIGASPLQTDKGAGAIEFDKLKNSAVMMAAPAAESYAVKDAAEKIGKLFGKDLNRADQIMYDSLIHSFDTVEKENLEAMKKVIDALAKYNGKDKEAIKKECVDAQREKRFTTAFAQSIADKMGVKL